MSGSLIFSGASKGGNSTTKPSETFTGEVFVDSIHRDDKVGIATVTFTPCARSFWHTHEQGQVLKVVAGSGWICDKGDKARRIKAGDVIYARAGTTHWHGADDGSILIHTAIGLGKTTWLNEVTDDEYKQRFD